MPNYSPDWAGWLQIKKTAGAATNPAVNTAFALPSQMWQPRNPKNINRPSVVNAALYDTVRALGMKTPTSRLLGPLKPSFWTLNFWNMLVANRDSNFATDEYAIGGNNVIGTRVWDGMHTALLQLTHVASEGVVNISIDSVGIYGNNEKSTPTSFTPPSNPDAGQLIDITKVDYNSTMDLVVSWQLMVMIRLRWRPPVPGTVYSQGIACGPLRGTFVVEQSPTYSVSPSSAATLKIGSAGAGVQLAMLLDPDDDNQPQTTDEGTLIRSYTLMDTSSGGNPIVATAM